MKTKYISKTLVVAALILIIFCSIALFSVSYAKWSGGNSVLNVGITLGDWIEKSVLEKLGTLNVNVDPSNEAVAILKESNPTGDGGSSWFGKPKYGGIICLNNDDVKAVVWNNNSLSKPHGATTDPVKLTAGTKFIICMFDRVVDPSNASRAMGTDGYSVLRGDGLSNLQYATEGKADDDTRVIFTALKDGFYTFSLYEGTKSDSSSDDFNKHDIVTVTYSETN